METEQPILQNKTFVTGLILLAVSFAVFMLGELTILNSGDDPAFGFFMINYMIAIAYLVILFVKYRWKLFTANQPCAVLYMLLLLISAYALNRCMDVFDQSTWWLCIYLLLSAFALIASAFINQLNKVLSATVMFLLGASLVLFIYLSIYLVPIYGFGLIGVLAIGVSLHAFVPLVLSVYNVRIILKNVGVNKRSWYPAVAGVILPLVLAGAYSVQWRHINVQANRSVNNHIISESTLPAWTSVAQHIPKGWIAEEILKTNLVYHVPDADRFFEWNMPNHSFDEQKKHDPLVVIASLFAGRSDLDDDNKIKVLESMYDSRQQAQERLWAGDKLETSNVISHVKFFPEYRLAYTEKIVSIRNNMAPKSWRPQQEAIYTFHLPEGSVVTSLSLWIDNKEEKAKLTTKGLADSAYKTIVGVENHDPSVIHWQEGNTVSVRIFPCTPDENRRFKIGITSPLKKTGGNLSYEDIYFDGPDASHADESVVLEFSQTPAGIDLPGSFTSDKINTYKCERGYEPYWETTFKAPKLDTEAFSFDHHSYQMSEYDKHFENFDPAKIYLDLNSSWTKDELMQVWNAVKNREVYIYQDEMVRVTNDNINTAYEQSKALNFSLFPIQAIHHPQQSLIISKSTAASPNLQDLGDSQFSKSLTTYMQTAPKIHLFNIGGDLSPYLKTLKELRTFIYDEGSVDDLNQLLQKKRYAVQQENDSTVVIGHAGVKIASVAGAAVSKAPDHLMRLFAYNDIMRKVAANYFTPKSINEDIINEAQQAYVVSPASSLIVLETQQDYQRFGITDNENSLKNASTKSSGSVPEPREWLLILLTACVVIYLLYKPRIKLNVK
ncbi:XrtN system VIT domain-containing protein [Mucilaginibacter gotjawali]|uniref:Uncharacterized protein n=2 Tax=Mucilaginibacter gotjawali TaxID=1550579 RepID=A0A110B1B8_9SPHI|nr:XrtN system VIT domain-containing protein [Mucilaginibacter gotjawali]MBB3059094.1 XrtN system VIT domain protein [Mucilaginibacter gotjawali]BAU52834.1 hypothetical protein MgSA37_00998 [Mucilaginibacter gotjawali]